MTAMLALIACYYPDDEVFFKRENLKVVYHDEFTGATVAIRPEVEIPRPPP